VVSVRDMLGHPLFGHPLYAACLVMHSQDFGSPEPATEDKSSDVVVGKHVAKEDEEYVFV